jgi:hypothetical protein
MFMRYDCPAIKNLKEEMRHEKEYQAHSNASRDAFLKMHAIFDDKDHSKAPDLDYFPVFDTLQGRLCHQMPMPSHNGLTVNQEDLTTVVNYTHFQADYSFRTGSSTPRRFAHVSGGQLMREVVNRLEGKDKDTPGTKFYLYSGHDTTMLMVLGILNSKDCNWPAYAANILVELWRVEDKKYVRVLYNGRTVETADGWCDLKGCDYNAFKRYLQPALDVDMAKECSA